jgi:hypothetical protein
MQPKLFRGKHLPWEPVGMANDKAQALKDSIMRNRVSTFGCHSLVTIREKVLSTPAWKDLRTAFARIPGIALVLLVCLAGLPGRAAAVFDDFESYAPGSNLAGQGGWVGWMNNPNAGALVSTNFAFSGSQSVNITGNSDLVQTFFGATNGLWVFSVRQYIPSTSTGTTYVVLMNTYRPPYGTTDLNWSVQIQNNMVTGQIISDLGGSATRPMVKDQWVEVRCEINLASNSVSEFYNGQLLSTHAWQGGSGGPGLNEIQALDLFANNAGPVYYDNVSLASKCVPPPAGMIGWWPLDETSGTTVADISGSGLNGTPSPGPIGPLANINGPTPVNGEVRGGLYFWHQYGNRYIDVPSSPALTFATNDFSIDAWVFITQYNGTELQPIVEKMQYSGTTPVQGYRFYLASGVLTFQVAVAGVITTTAVASTDQVSQDVWHLVAVTYHRPSSGNQPVLLYIDGAPAASTSLPSVGNFGNSTSDLIIGGSILGSAINYLDIHIDEVEMFNVALAQ